MCVMSKQSVGCLVAVVRQSCHLLHFFTFIKWERKSIALKSRKEVPQYQDHMWPQGPLPVLISLPVVKGRVVK